MDLSARQKLSTGFLIAGNAMPYFRTPLLRLLRCELPGIGTLMTSEGWHMYYDPAFIHEVAPTLEHSDVIAGLVVHEMCHPLRFHAARQRALNADHRLFNIAGDLAINPMIIKAGLKLPTGKHKGVFPADYGFPEGKTTEEYYELLKKFPNGGEGGKDGAPMSVAAGSCGSCAGNKHPKEPDAHEVPGRSEPEIEALVRDTAKAIKEHAAQHGRGSIPAGWEVWADSKLAPPKISFKSKLRTAARQVVAYTTGIGEYVYTKPARRQAALGYGIGRPVLPAQIRPIPNILIITDTSGSMGTEEGTQCLSEMSGIFRDFNMPIKVMSCDAGVHGIVEARNVAQVRKSLKGGGGTDFHPAFKAADEMKPRPSVIIFMTDGDGYCPPEPPRGIKVYWVLVGRHAHSPCKWGEQIFVDPKDK